MKLKVTDYISDRGVVINEIDRLIQKMKIIVILEYQRLNKKKSKRLQRRPGIVSATGM